MKIPWYKFWWSYVNEIILESSNSDINGDLYLSLNKGQYQLCTRNAIYSYGDRYDNFRDSFAQLRLDLPRVQTVLVLGMGLGSIPYMLEKRFKQKMEFTCVEPDEEIIHWAHEYVFCDLISFIEVLQTDAATFVSMTEEKYDMICVDVFTDTQIPEDITDPEFMEELKLLLTPSGFILFNHLAMYREDTEKAMHYFDNVFKKEFETAAYLKLRSNIMLVSDSSRIKK